MTRVVSGKSRFWFILLAKVVSLNLSRQGHHYKREETLQESETNEGIEEQVTFLNLYKQLFFLIQVKKQPGEKFISTLLVVKSDDQIRDNDAFLQQDSAPPHYVPSENELLLFITFNQIF